jgi:hypothetical protein
VDLKRELPTHKRTLNTELAQDLASLAVDSGLLVIGIEDHDSHAGKVCGVELARLADRVDQVARDKVHPSLVVRSQEVPDPARPGWGCLLVHVPGSPEAPHMVDYVYYGRATAPTLSSVTSRYAPSLKTAGAAGSTPWLSFGRWRMTTQ